MSNDWALFRGDGVTRAVQFPPPPPWRKFEVATEHRARTYRPTPDDVRIVNVALHLRRPLLVEGPPGSGKTSLAFAVARELQLGPLLMWPINSRTTLREGLYAYDAVGRLNDSGVSSVSRRWFGTQRTTNDIEKYLKLGPLGTALLPSERPRVLLIDEIDKSDGDLPNDLLHVLENGWFSIPELERIAKSRSTVTLRIDPGEGGPKMKTEEIFNGRVQTTTFPFVVITSNGERDLPPAFLRRCVRHAMPDSDRDRLTDIISAHLGSEIAHDSADLVGRFLSQIQQGEQLAIDQLLNAVFLLDGNRGVPPSERDEIIRAVLQDLNES